MPYDIVKKFIPKYWRYYYRFHSIIREDQREMKALSKNTQEQTALKAQVAKANSPEEIVTLAKELFDTLQLPGEITPLLERLNQANAKKLCEIGTWGGGTNFILSQGVKTAQDVIGIDLHVRNRFKLQLLKPEHQNLHLINGASTSIGVLDAVSHIVGDEGLDFCLIDGDHTYQGVKEDFEHYQHLMKEGGLIAFHDINPDHGDADKRCAGEVPRFWQEIKQAYNHEEYIQNPADQSGFGIGVIEWKKK